MVGPRRVPSSIRGDRCQSHHCHWTVRIENHCYWTVRIEKGSDPRFGLGQPIACRPSVWRLTAQIPGWVSVSWWLLSCPMGCQVCVFLSVQIFD